VRIHLTELRALGAALAPEATWPACHHRSSDVGRRLGAWLCAGACTLAAPAVTALPADAAVDELVFVSRASGSDGAGGDHHSFLTTDWWSAPQSRISHDGRYVAFDSWAGNLSSEAYETNNAFLRDVDSGQTRLLNPQRGWASHAAISADGERVAFVTSAALSDEDVNATHDVYLRDVADLEDPKPPPPTLVSHPTAELPSGGGTAPSLSGDGGRVAFHDPGGSGVNAGVFVWDMETNVTTLVSRESGPDGPLADGPSGGAAISADGRHVAFTSLATNLSADHGSSLDVFVRDLQTDRTTLVSREIPTISPYAFRPTISADGRYVGFEAGDVCCDGTWVYRRDLERNETSVVSAGMGSSGWHSMSADGRYLAFASWTWIANGAFVRDMATERTIFVSRRPAAGGGGHADGRSFSAAISGDGRYVAFESEAMNLSANDRDEFTDVFRARISFADAPQITITKPADGDAYARASEVAADYECVDTSGTGMAYCIAPVVDGGALDTATPGDKTFTVDALDSAGNVSSLTHRYRVVDDTTPPTIAIRSPAEGGTYAAGELVHADYECADEDDGSGLASCTGTVADGDPIDTGTPGEMSLTVTAADRAGNERTETVTYLVAGDDTPPDVTLRTPPNGATYTVGEPVLADYECADESGGSGLASCTGTVPDGDPIDTGSEGEKTFTVTASDSAGNSREVTNTYRVTPAGCVELKPGDLPKQRSIAGNETHCFWFDGTARDRIRLRALRIGGNATFDVVVRRPSDTILCTTAFSTEVTRDCELDADGIHRVLVGTRAGASGEYRLYSQRLNPPAGCGDALEYGGAPVTGRIEQPPETECHAFTGADGDKFRLRALRTSGGATFDVTVLKPDGTILCTTAFITEVTRDCQLDADGTHHALLSTRGTGTGEYALALYLRVGDIDPPETKIDSGPSGPAARFDFSSDEPSSTFECRIDAQPWRPCSSPWTAANLSQGLRVFWVRAIDRAGNADATPASRSFTVTIDTVPPVATVDSGPVRTHDSPIAILAFSSNEPGSRFECRIDGAPFAACSSPYTTGALADGEHTFDVRAIDSSGNTGSPASRTFVVATAEPDGGGDDGGTASVQHARQDQPVSDVDGDGVPDTNDRSVVTAPPQPGETATAEVKRGTVMILEGGRFRPLEGRETIPIGATIDATDGAITIEVAADTAGARLQTGTFSDGAFKLEQIRRRAGRLITELVLKGGTPRVCGARASTAHQRGKRRKVRRLWGDGKGRFRTRGSNSAATVRGTVWLTKDGCAGTLTRVKEGRVAVKDFGRDRTVIVRAGDSYLAKANG
jgi:Tol biopolymer transport system component